MHMMVIEMINVKFEHQEGRAYLNPVLAGKEWHPKDPRCQK